MKTHASATYAQPTQPMRLPAYSQQQQEEMFAFQPLSIVFGALRKRVPISHLM